jgi:hypothetical protein
MSNRFSNVNGADLGQIDIRKFSDFDVSWAGQGRSKGEFWLGSEDGRTLITDGHLQLAGSLKEFPLTSNEAINGLAFHNGTIAFSTRCEVVLVSSPPGTAKGLRSVFPAGAHGVIATPSGYFVAPLGRSGVMVVKPSVEEDQPLTIRKASHKPMNFYKVVHISYAGGEVLAFAARSDGIVAMPFLSQGNEFISSWNYPGLDVVDVCSLGDNLDQPAIAAISRDGTIILSRDALHDPAPRTIKFQEVKGVAYRVLNFYGNLLLLTSKALYLLPALGQRFLDGQSLALECIPVNGVPPDVVDANIVDGRSLLVVVPSGVILSDLDLLTGAEPSRGENDETRPIEMFPQWQPYEDALESESRMMANAV